jgi:hypothetical protein
MTVFFSTEQIKMYVYINCGGCGCTESIEVASSSYAKHADTKLHRYFIQLRLFLNISIRKNTMTS